MVLTGVWAAPFNLTTSVARFLGIRVELLAKGSHLTLAFALDFCQASLQRFDLFLWLVDHRLHLFDDRLLLLKQRPAILAIGVIRGASMSPKWCPIQPVFANRSF